MHQLISSLAPRQPYPAVARAAAFREPHYDCREQMGALKLTIYVPGVDPSGVEIEVHGPDLTVTAPKRHPVRANWRALHLEPVQRDYQLHLRLGANLDYDALHAELREGVLVVVIPKRSAATAASAA